LEKRTGGVYLKSFNVKSGGKRGELPLTVEQKAEIDEYLTHFDLDGVIKY